MNNKVKTAIALLCFGFVGALSADPVTWDTYAGAGICTSGVGNNCKFTDSSHTLTAYAYSTTDNSGTTEFEKATLTVWSGGLGVKNPDQSNENSSPNHALDDNGRDELIVFENGDPGNYFTGFKIGWRYSDSDISAWVGSLSTNYDFTGTRFSDLAGMGFTKVDFSNVPTNTQRSLGSLAGNYLILAPSADSNSEYVKISQVSGEIPNKVSEPGIMALFAVTLMGLWANRRRNAS
ncbi:MAG: PEP-CTERM sorting domain-containing protein [Burkholderiales bacterium]|nr:PEP-CTERM sorting domain-containing protein [Burkholderiales bacterium]MDR4516689.1 hypothetical protein [Nitrosomonas sp.]